MRGIPQRKMMVDYMEGDVDMDFTKKGDSRDTSDEVDERHTIEEDDGRLYGRRR